MSQRNPAFQEVSELWECPSPTDAFPYFRYGGGHLQRRVLAIWTWSEGSLYVVISCRIQATCPRGIPWHFWTWYPLCLPKLWADFCTINFDTETDFRSPSWMYQHWGNYDHLQTDVAAPGLSVFVQGAGKSNDCTALVTRARDHGGFHSEEVYPSSRVFVMSWLHPRRWRAWDDHAKPLKKTPFYETMKSYSLRKCSCIP